VHELLFSLSIQDERGRSDPVQHVAGWHRPDRTPGRRTGEGRRPDAVRHQLSAYMLRRINKIESAMTARLGAHIAGTTGTSPASTAISATANAIQ
jgi:hypothetical protein